MFDINFLSVTPTPLDFVDIGVVAFVLYRIYLMLKDTRAATLIKGLFVLGIFYFICDRLNLHVISWILQKSVAIIMVALPIIFQPELRRALEQIGHSGLFRKGSELNEQELNKMLDEVADAVKAMSKQKVGALICFERETGLADRIDTGIAIDGIVSSGLLQNIFVKDTPLHDGAVVIRGNRIVASNCLLPLTDRRNLEKELGTRHRAAIGLSEQSDALILVVSEETGAISVARNGQINRFLSASDARGILVRGIVSPHVNFMDDLKKNWEAFCGELVRRWNSFRGGKHE